MGSLLSPDSSLPLPLPLPLAARQSSIALPSAHQASHQACPEGTSLKTTNPPAIPSSPSPADYSHAPTRKQTIERLQLNLSPSSTSPSAFGYLPTSSIFVDLAAAPTSAAQAPLPPCSPPAFLCPALPCRPQHAPQHPLAAWDVAIYCCVTPRSTFNSVFDSSSSHHTTAMSSQQQPQQPQQPPPPAVSGAPSNNGSADASPSPPLVDSATLEPYTFPQQKLKHRQTEAGKTPLVLVACGSFSRMPLPPVSS